MEILIKMNERNFNEVAKLIQDNQIPEQLMSGNLKNQLRRYRQAFSTPASISAALKHQQTVKYGYRPPARTPDEEVCGCCNVRVYKQEIPICYKVQPEEKKGKQFLGDFNQYKLKSDVALFFTFVKSCIILALLNSIVHSIFNLLTSKIFGQNCQNTPQCEKNIWNTLSASNKFGQQNWLMIVDILNLVGIVLTILFFTYNRRRQYKLNALIDCETQNEADYTLFISNIPLLQFPKKGQQNKRTDRMEFFYRKYLEDFFNKIIQNWLNSKDNWYLNNDKVGMQLQKLMDKNNGQLRSDDIVKTVSLCYNLSRLEVIQQIKAELIEQYEKQGEEGTSLLVNENGEPVYSQRFGTIPERISFLNDCEMVLNGQFARDNSFLFSVTHFTGHAFVSFQYEHYKQAIQRMYNENPKALNYNGNILKIEYASHPTDIYWENIRVSEKERRRKIVSSYLILFMVLVFSFVFLLLLQLVKESVAQSTLAGFINVTLSYSITICIAVVILMVNYGLNYLAHVLTEAEKRKTRTDYSLSVLIKTFLTKLINTIMLYFFIALLFRNNHPQAQFMGPTGLVFQISMLIVVTGLLHVFKSLIYPKQLWLKLVRWWRYRKIEDRVDNKFQKTLNKQFEYPEFEFTSRYTHYLVTLYTAFFYSYLVPISVPVVCVLFFLQYWVDKYILLRRSSLKYHFGFFLSNETTKILESSVLALGLGNLLFSSYMQKTHFNVISLIGFGISLVFTLLVWLTPKKLQTIIFGEYEYNQKYTYDDCLRDGKFEATYWTQNPATFLIEEQKVTGRRKVANPALNRKSIEGDVFLSSFNS